MLITGSNRNDNIVGTDGSDTIDARGGNDRVSARGGKDQVSGGTGNDKLFGGTSGDRIRGDDGNDEVYGEGGDDVLHGGRGDDYVHSGSGRDSVYGDAGNDVLTYIPGEIIPYDRVLARTVADGGGGADTLRLSVAAGTDIEVFYGGNAAGRISLGSLVPDDEADLWSAGSVRNVERFEFTTPNNIAFYGSDSGAGMTVIANAGNDILADGNGDDRFRGGAGDDYFVLNRAGHDVLRGEGGADLFEVWTPTGRKEIVGFDFFDTVSFMDYPASKDEVDGRTVFTLFNGATVTVDAIGLRTSNGGASYSLLGGDGPVNVGPFAPDPDRTVTGTEGPDRLVGTGASEFLDGRGDDDVLVGAGNGDILNGGPGNDILQGGEGRDVLYGGAGNDFMEGGGVGNDLFGEEGDDTLLFTPGITAVPQDVPFSWIDGGEGKDTLIITNETTTARQSDGAIIPGLTSVYFEEQYGVSGEATENTLAFISLGDAFGLEDVNAYGRNIERFEFRSEGPVLFEGTGNILGFSEPDNGIEIVGSGNDDWLRGTYGNDIIEGREGNDRLSGDQGDDLLISGLDDEDLIFSSVSNSDDFVIGFNGAGSAGGDILVFQEMSPDELDVTEQGGQTLFEYDFVTQFNERIEGSITVDATGLVDGVDYFRFVPDLPLGVWSDYGFVS